MVACIYKYLEFHDTAQFSLCITQKMFVSCQHHTTQKYHGFSQRNKQVDYQYEHYCRSWQTFKKQPGYLQYIPALYRIHYSTVGSTNILVNTLFSRSVLTENDPSQDSNSPHTPPSQRQVESFKPCIRQNDRFVNPSGNPLQPGTIIICNNIPFVVSNNVKIYNFTGGSMKQLYVTDPSKHKFVVTSANSLSTFSNIFSSVLGLFLRFNNRQNNSNKHKDEHQKQSRTEASNLETMHTTNSNKGMNISTDTIQEVNGT